MSQEEIGEVTFRLKPVIDQAEVQRAMEQAVATAANAIAASQRAQTVSGAASASAAIAQAGSSRASLTSTSSQPALTAGVEGSYTRSAISRTLLSEMRSEIDMIQGLYDEQFNAYARPTSFAGDLPGEIRRQLQGHPNRQRIRGLLSTNVPGGNAEDLMADLGEEKYFRGLEYMAGTPMGHALEAGQKYGSPRQQWLSGLALHQASRHKTPLPVMEHINIAALPTGTRFSTAGYEHQIIEPDEGQRMLRSPFSRNDLPLEAMGMIPVDVGSERQPKQVSIESFGDGLENFPGLPAPVDPQTARQGLRIPLPQYTRRQLALPSPRNATQRFSDYHSEPEPFNWRTGAASRLADMRQSSNAAIYDSHRYDQVNAEASSMYDALADMRQRDPRSRLPGFGTVGDAINIFETSLRGIGFDPSKPYAPKTVSHGQPIVTPLRNLLGLPAPGEGVDAIRSHGGAAAGGGGGRRGGPPMMSYPGDDWGWDSQGDGYEAHGRFNHSGRRYRRPTGFVGRMVNRYDRAIGAVGKYVAEHGGRRATLFGMAGRAILGGAGSIAMRGLRPANRFRVMRTAALARRLGNTPFMSFGNYMSLFWGGGEVANAVSALGNAGILGSMTGNMQEKAQLQLQAYQQASAGFFGRFANLAIDPFGAKQASIQATLQNSAGIDSFIDDQRTWVRSMRYAGMPSAATDVGQQFSGFAASIVGMNDARRERMSSFREQRKAFVADAVNAAGPRGIMEEGDIALWESIGLPTKRGLMVRDRMMDAANSAYANQSALMARDKLMGQQADQATITAQFNAMTMGQIREAQDANLQRAYIGNPVNGQRAAMILGFQREMQDIRNPKFQKQYMDQMKEAGFTGSQAFSMFNDFYNSVSARQSAQMQAFDAQTIYGMNLTRQSMDSSLRIADAARGVMAGTPGARAELDDANLDSEEANMKRALIDQGFGPNEAALRATMNRISHRADIGARRSRIENIRKMQEQRQFESLSSQFDVTRRGRSRVRDARRSLRENGGAFNTVTNASLVSQAESEAYSVGRAGGMERMATQLVADYFDDLDAVRSEFLSQFRPTQYDDISAIDTTGTRGRAELNALRPTFEGVQSIFNARREGYLQHLQEREARIHIEQMTNPGF